MRNLTISILSAGVASFLSIFLVGYFRSDKNAGIRILIIALSVGLGVFITKSFIPHKYLFISLFIFGIILEFILSFYYKAYTIHGIQQSLLTRLIIGSCLAVISVIGAETIMNSLLCKKCTSR